MEKLAAERPNLLGKTVQVNLEGGNIVGEVTTITFEQGVPALTIQTTDGEFVTDVSLSNITIVR